MTSLSDNKLLDLFTKERSEDALAQLVERYTPLVYGSALRQLNDSASAEDVTQAVFIALWNKAKQLRNAAALPAWLLSATRFACLDAIKSKTARIRHEQEASNMPKDNPAIDSTALSAILDETLVALPSMDRAVVARRYLLSQNFQEIAASLAISPEAAKKRVSRALMRLRQRLADRGLNNPADVLESGLVALAVHHVPPSLAPSIQAACHGRVAPSVDLLSKHIQLKVAVTGIKAAVVATAVTGAVIAAAVTLAVMALNGPQNSGRFQTTSAPSPISTQPTVHAAASPYPEIYIGGQVKRPGAYQMAPREINLVQFIVVAGGPDAGITPDRARVLLMRKNGSGQPTPSSYLFSDLIASRSSIAMQADDVVYVLDDSRRTIRLGPQAADDHQIFGDEVVGVGLVNFNRGGLTVDRLPVGKGGTIAPTSISPIKVIGLNAQQIADALNKAFAEAAAPNASPSRVAYVNIYLSYSNDLGKAGLAPADHLIVAGDLLDITIHDLLGQGQGPFELNKRVSADDSVYLPFIGPVKTAGLKAAELETALNKAYADARILRNADASVKVVEVGK